MQLKCHTVMSFSYKIPLLGRILDVGLGAKQPRTEKQQVAEALLTSADTLAKSLL